MSWMGTEYSEFYKVLGWVSFLVRCYGLKLGVVKLFSEIGMRRWGDLLLRERVYVSIFKGKIITYDTDNYFVFVFF